MTITVVPAPSPAEQKRATPRPQRALPRSTRPPHLEVVPPRHRSPQARRRRARLIAGAGVLISCLAVFGLVGVHVLLAQGQFRLAHLQSQADDQQARYIRLRLEVAQLESPERIVAAAQERLGMVAPSSVTYLTPTGPPAPSAAPSRPAAAAHEATDTTQRWAVVKPALTGRP